MTEIIQCTCDGRRHKCFIAYGDINQDVETTDDRTYIEHWDLLDRVIKEEVERGRDRQDVENEIDRHVDRGVFVFGFRCTECGMFREKNWDNRRANE